MTNSDFDIAIVGSGFGGSLLAMIARRLGLRVVLVERERHPRFAIGESSTPLANLLIEELARRYDLRDLLPFTQWGTWQEHRPDVACGLKRGFTFYHHALDQPWVPDPARGNELLVAASPDDAVADTHWYRPEFDQALARMAVRLGAELIEGVELGAPEFIGDGVVLRGRADGRPIGMRCRFLVDATGPRGFLARALAIEERRFASMPSTQSLFTHFTGVERWDALHSTALGGELPPYPPDDAALHHVFPGGWIWVLRFNNGITSAGVAATDAFADELRLAEGAPAWERLLARLPGVRGQFASAQATMPFRHLPRMPWRASRMSGDHWALLPSAAGFIDPLLSTGFPLTLLGIERLAHWLERAWGTPAARAELERYEATTFAELDLTADLIGALYRCLGDFDSFTDLSLLYFAAASYSETARRLNRGDLAPGFLLGRHPAFGPALRGCLDGVLKGNGGGLDDRRSLADRVRRAMDAVNVAGLGDAARKNWYPVRFEDLFAAAGKVGADRASIDAMLKLSAGFAESLR